MIYGDAIVNSKHILSPVFEQGYFKHGFTIMGVFLEVIMLFDRPGEAGALLQKAS